MEIIKQSQLSIPDMVALLKQGKTMVYPTETCYGLGCDATNPEAVSRIFDIKQRQRNKPVLVVVSDESMIMEYVVWNETLQKISEKYWPGPVTAVVPIKDIDVLPAGVVGDDHTLAFRITDHPLARTISQSLGRPLVSTSANIASLKSPYDIGSVMDMFEHAMIQPDIIIDAGELAHQSPSTVVRVLNGDIDVLRQGEVVVDI